VAAGAAFAEGRSDRMAAAVAYADAAERWQQFGVVPEQALALLGLGRCLTALGRSAEARQALQQAREIFDTLRAAPALAEAETLLRQADALSA
jgi:tetratricopeptide (TPR) repeat protein